MRPFSKTPFYVVALVATFFLFTSRVHAHTDTSSEPIQEIAVHVDSQFPTSSHIGDKPKKKKKFVDKNGDGINDGQEHRFKRKRNRHAKHNKKQLKKQKQKGKTNGNQKGK